MPLTLYGAPGSGSAAIEMALRAARVDYMLVRAATWEPGAGLDALRAVNPLGQIPTLVLLDGTVLTESAAILLSIALQYPEAALLPADPVARALAIRGLVFIAANCYAAVSVSDYPERWTTARDAAAHRQLRQAARQQLHRSWEVLADMLSSHPALLEGEPGALAFLSVVVSQWSGTRKHLAVARPAFHEALQRMAQHPLIAPVLATHAAAS